MNYQSKSSSAPLMIVLFPEEACSAADRVWGKHEAYIQRQRMGNVIHNWSDSAWVISGPSAEELSSSGMFGVHVESVLRKPQRNFSNQYSYRMKTRVNDLDDIIHDLRKHLRVFRLSKKTPITLVGAWYSDKKYAEVNMMKDALEQFGYTVKLGPVLLNPYDEDQEDREMVYEDIVMEEKARPLMIVVHPGSACGSADYNIGKQLAADYRSSIANDLSRHNGPLLIVDGEGSSELPNYSILNNAIETSLTKNKSAGHYTNRVFACDDVTPNWPTVVRNVISKMKLPNKSRVYLTGAWYFEDDSNGCVNAVYEEVEGLGLDPMILDSAIRDPDGELDWDDDDEEEE